MSYYDKLDEYDKKGIDYNLVACLENNPQKGFGVDDIQQVLGVWEGEHDGDDWRWILSLKDGRFVFLQGGCDYTGWDCQSWAKSNFTTTALEAAEFAKTGPTDATVQEAVVGMGMGRMFTALTGGYMINAGEVYESLVKQLETAKVQTWREKKDVEFGLADGHEAKLPPE